MAMFALFVLCLFVGALTFSGISPLEMFTPEVSSKVSSRL